jgi:hypothetical protein
VERTRVIEKKECKIFYSCRDKEHKVGTGFVVSKRVQHTVTHFEARAPRLCWLRIKRKFFKHIIINVHAPTEDKSEDEKEDFCDDLRRLYDSCPKRL